MGAMNSAPPIRPLRILLRDEHLVVADKPAGLAVHRGWAPERDVAMTRVRDAIGAHVYPVHRLDRGTSGVLVFALSSELASAFSQLFASGGVQKTYLALVRSVPPEEGITRCHLAKTATSPVCLRGPPLSGVRCSVATAWWRLVPKPGACTRSAAI